MKAYIVVWRGTSHCDESFWVDDHAFSTEEAAKHFAENQPYGPSGPLRPTTGVEIIYVSVNEQHRREEQARRSQPSPYPARKDPW